MDLYDPSDAVNKLIESIITHIHVKYEDPETKADILKMIGEGLIASTFGFIVKEDRARLVEPFCNDLRDNLLKVIALLEMHNH